MASINSKMIFFSVATLALGSASVFGGVWTQSVLTSNIDELSTVNTAVRTHMEADMMHDAIRGDVFSALLINAGESFFSIEEIEANLADHIKNFDAAIALNKTLVTDPATAATLKKLDQPLADYSKAAKLLVDEISAKKVPASEELKVFEQQFETLETAMAEAGDQVQALSSLVSDHSESVSQQSKWLLYSLLLIVAVFSFCVWLTSRASITRPILMLLNRMTSLAQGENDTVVPSLGRKDEVGGMAASVEVFRKAAIEKQQMEQEAEANRRQAEANRIADQQRAEAEAAERMRIATSGLAEGLKRLAAGDVSFQLNEAFASDFEALRLDFNRSVAQLGQTLSTVAQSVVSITNGSHEISSGTNDLSKRTEQQAASLEETAAALDQITVNVKSSSMRTEEARGVAAQANRSATKSGAVVSQAVDAMSRIEESSRQISNIIGVIDEIAFQTNLLALNAGVEAARAGDAGKGFAVVAQEVRELAQRSASAAKEIKGLIQTSTAEVSTGVKLVSETGEALKSIGGFIVDINQHMEAIATSSREQSVGLAEVNTAVNQMDQTTQQNAAMVEESSAAASSLATEAASLGALIGQFELGQSGDPVRSLRQTASTMARHSTTSAPAKITARRTASGNAAVAQEWSEF